MSDRAISLRDLYFVRDVLIPRCAWVQGPEVEELIQLRLRIDAVITAIATTPPTDSRCTGEPPSNEGKSCV